MVIALLFGHSKDHDNVEIHFKMYLLACTFHRFLFNGYLMAHFYHFAKKSFTDKRTEDQENIAFTLIAKKLLYYLYE